MKLNMLKPISEHLKKGYEKGRPTSNDLVTWEWNTVGHSLIHPYGPVYRSHGWVIERRSLGATMYYACTHKASGMVLEFQKIGSLKRAKAICEFAHQFIPYRYKTKKN